MQGYFIVKAFKAPKGTQEVVEIGAHGVRLKAGEFGIGETGGFQLAHASACFHQIRKRCNDLQSKKMLEMLHVPTCTHGNPSITPMAYLVVDRLDDSELATTQTPSLRRLINEVVQFCVFEDCFTYALPLQHDQCL